MSIPSNGSPFPMIKLITVTAADAEATGHLSHAGPGRAEAPGGREVTVLHTVGITGPGCRRGRRTHFDGHKSLWDRKS